ncbi:MAG: hypothetical protein NTV23_00190 [Propionibacteriales bacterium]|nr:hypothetical protein [Propionibacteriales bacterium]
MTGTITPSRPVRLVRLLVGALGLAAGLWGAWLMSDLGVDNLVASGTWLVGGVVLHDAVIGPVTIALAAVAVRLSRRSVPGPVIVGGIVLGSVTLAVVPVLGRFGAHADNPSLLPRDYVGGWLVFAGLTLTAVVVALLVGRRSAKDGEHGAGSGRR